MVSLLVLAVLFAAIPASLAVFKFCVLLFSLLRVEDFRDRYIKLFLRQCFYRRINHPNWSKKDAESGAQFTRRM